MDFIQQHIAAQLKKIRHERELSLDQLATLNRRQQSDAVSN